MERPSHLVGANVLIIRDGNLLLGKRKGGSGAGEWGLPGGHVEYGETFEECALREIEEEAGMRADSVRFVGVTHQAYQSSSKHYVNFLFIAEGVTGEPYVAEPEFCEEWQWFPLTDLPVPLFFGHKDLIFNYIQNVMFSEWKTA